MATAQATAVRPITRHSEGWQILHASLAEAVGTFGLVFAGTGAIIILRTLFINKIRSIY